MQECMSNIPARKKTGFVPTMGALHAGHISLIESSTRECDYTIASIYVNPKQFNDPSDFLNYPVTIDNDIKLLEAAGCDAVFIPETSEIYNNYSGYIIDYEGLDKILEGAYRPGHFKAVVDIVYRLFDIVKPSFSYFGQKDYQQLLIIKKMLEQTEMKITIRPCAIIREESGLAMSSRNMRLSVEEKESASQIFKIMESIDKAKIVNQQAKLIEEKITERINSVKHLKTEYVSFCEPNSLKPVIFFVKGSTVILCLAVYCGKIRLIDNKVLVF